MRTSLVKRLQLLAHELSGSFGDLGTFLPLVLGAIAVAGCSPGAIFTLFGLFYLATGSFYRVPVPVQPMKVAAAAVLTGVVTPAELSGATLVIGLLLLALSLTGAAEMLARMIPSSVVTGLQAGLGIMLGLLGAKLIAGEPLIGLVTLAVMAPFGFNRLLPQALVGLLVGAALEWGMHGVPPLPVCIPLLQLPQPALPGWADIWHGTLRIGLPQLSLTLVNSVIITTALAGKLFPGNRAVTPQRLTLTMGVANCVSGVLGGFPMCHGAGGLAGHYRFGARTGLPALLLGSVLLLIGILFADAGGRLLALVPTASLGALLFWSSLEMVRSGKRPATSNELLFVALVAVLTIWTNAALALLGGVLLDRVRMFRRSGNDPRASTEGNDDFRQLCE